MKILTATSETQGHRGSDFNWCEEGEPVRFGFECDRDKEEIDGGCGCQRSMAGMQSQTATTTMKVVDRADMDVDKFKPMVRVALDAGGWLKLGTEKDNEEWIESESKELLRVAATFRAGTIVEKRGDELQERILSAVAAY